MSLTLPAAGVASRMLPALAFCFAASMVYVAIIRRIKFRNTVLVPVVGLMYGSVLSAVAEFYAYRHNIPQSMQGWLLGDFSRVVRAATKSCIWCCRWSPWPICTRTASPCWAWARWPPAWVWATPPRPRRGWCWWR